MLTPQRILPWLAGLTGDHPQDGPRCASGSWSRSGPGTLPSGFLLLVLAWIPLPGTAQSRATLQVAAQVVEAGPGLQALARVQRPLPPGSIVRTSLATIRFEALTPDSVARRRPRITVNFVRN